MSTSIPEDLELEALRRHVADLEEAVAERRRSVERLAESEQRFCRILEATHEAFVVFREGIIVQVNQPCMELFRLVSPDDFIGKSPFEFCTPEALPIVRHHFQMGNEAPYDVFLKRRDGSSFLAEIQGRTTSYQGHPARVSVFRDVTEREQVEEALHAASRQKEMIRAQEAVLAQLSSPLLPIGNATVVLPLIGAVNAQRAAQVVQTLIEGVARSCARTAILDITGVPDVDAQVADALLQAARAVRLLGAHVVLTGIRPEVAQRFALLGADLSGIVTYGTLERGIKSSLGRDAAQELR